MTGQVQAGEEGFTLIELLVSLAITAAASAVLAATLWSGHAAVARTGAAVAGGESVAAAQGVLRDRIAHLLSDATPTIVAPDGGSPQPAEVDAVGDARAFSFVVGPQAVRSPAPPVRYLIERDGGGGLMLATIDARAFAARGGRARRVPLLEGVAAVQFAYYGKRLAGQAARWWTDWPGGDPPALVRIRLRFKQGDDRRWPDLVVHPEVSVAATCRVSPVNGDCA